MNDDMEWEDFESGFNKLRELNMKLDPFRDPYISYLAEKLGISETYTAYLHSGIEESNVRRFIVVAYHLARARRDKPFWMPRFLAARQRWAKIITASEKSIDEEVHHDGPNVMNMVGVLGSLKENRSIIFTASRKLFPLLPAAMVSLVDEEDRERMANEMSPEEFFQILVRVPENAVIALSA